MRPATSLSATCFLTTAARIVLLGAVCVIPGRASAMRSPFTVYDNVVEWREDGRVRARVYSTEATAGIGATFLPRIDGGNTVGQTFRCAGDELAAVQLGLHDDFGGLQGIYSPEPELPDIQVTVRRGGLNGDIVFQDLMDGNALDTGSPIRIEQPTTKTTEWYLELKVPAEDSPQLHALGQVGNTYPHGRTYVNGEPQEDADLSIRIHSASQVRGRRRGPYVFWHAPPEERIWMNPERTVGAMLQRGADRQLTLSAARNEWVCFQLAATPAPDAVIRSAELKIPALTGPAAAQIRRIRIERVRYVKEVVSKRWPDPVPTHNLYPDALEPVNTVTYPAEHAAKRLNTAFWVSLQIPEGIPAGRYETTAEITVNGDTKLTKDIRINVWDFDLPRQTHTKYALYGASGGGEYDIHLKWNRDLAEHRIGSDNVFYRNHLHILRNRRGYYEHEPYSEEAYKLMLNDTSRQSLIDFGSLYHKWGFGTFSITPWGDVNRMFLAEDDATRQAAEEGYIRYLKTFYPLVKERGWVDNVYIRMRDEFRSTPENIAKVQHAANLARKHAPGVKILITAMGTSDIAELEQADPIADIWCPNLKPLAKALPYFLKRMENGDEVWPYIHFFTWHFSDVASVRMYYWMLEKYGFDGTCYWTIGPRGRYEHPWYGVVRYDRVLHGDGGLYYAGNTLQEQSRVGAGYPRTALQETDDPESLLGLWRSARLALMREGAEDREYFWLMNDLADKAAKAGNLSGRLKRRIERANQYPQQMVHGISNFEHDPDKVDEMRSDMAAIIMALRKRVSAH